ncbi:MAG: LytR/AlgR family response regulator transcription factor [Flavobacteriaceae bacterium]
MNVIIIEDEKPAARLLSRKLEKLNISVNQMLHSVEESLKWFSENSPPDLIFLDIQLSDGLSFEIFEQFPVKSAIIFTTAYDQYALRAFKLNSIDYLLKPIDEKELTNAVEKFRERVNKKAGLDLQWIKSLLVSEEKQYKERFSVKVGLQLKIIITPEIECFFSENKGTYIHTTENRNYLMDSTLEQLENELNPKEFFRVSRKFIVALKAIKEIQVYSNSRLKIILNTYKEDEIIVSRERVADFKNWIG